MTVEGRLVAETDAPVPLTGPSLSDVKDMSKMIAGQSQWHVCQTSDEKAELGPVHSQIAQVLYYQTAI